ncbi:MAG: Crp/Fnr family transcriptional regulator [Paludibacter sp.]|nr:Crp/Fnr family transcriptional regulator [Paludibacter sp.]
MDANDLFLCPICSNVPPNERESFLNGLQIKTKYYKKGEWIAQQGDAINALYLLIKGSVKTEMISESGTTLNIEVINAPNPLASAFLFAHNNCFPIDVIAIDDCTVIIASKTSILRQLEYNQAFLLAFLSFNANRTYFLSERLKFLSIKTIKGKFAQYIFSKSKGKDTNFILNMNRTNLAEYFGIARPSLSRSISEMVNEGIISIKGKRGKILNFKKLQELICI